MSHIARTTGLAAIVALLLTAPAFAHAHLRSAVPAVGSTITVSPGLIDLIFSESVNFEFTGITVTGPDKTEVPTTGAMLMDNDDGCIGIDTYHCQKIDHMGPLVTLTFHLKIPDVHNAYAGLGYHSCRFEEEAKALAATLQTQLRQFHLNPLKMPVQNPPERKVVAFPFRPA